MSQLLARLTRVKTPLLRLAFALPCLPFLVTPQPLRAQCSLTLDGVPGNTAARVINATIGNCVPPTNSTVLQTATVDWGDSGPSGTRDTSSAVPPATLTHTYNSALATLASGVVASPGVNGTSFNVTLQQPPSFGQFPQVNQLLSFPIGPLSFASFAGQSAFVMTTVAVPAAMTFSCTTAVDATGTIRKTDDTDLNITCFSLPGTVMPPGNSAGAVAITVVAQTSGLASTFAYLRSKPLFRFASLLPIAAFALAFGCRARTKTRTLLRLSTLLIAAIALTSCGGGFGAPLLSAKVTPPGVYQVHAFSTYVSNGVPSYFGQVSLIVPLTVLPPQ
jgi:hypothetical protein